MSGLTRFAQRYEYHTSNGTLVKTTRDGPVSGGLQTVFIPIPSITKTGTTIYEVQPPPGATYEVVAGHFTCSATSDTPSMVITGAATVVAAVTCTTNLGALTIASGACNNTSPLNISITTTASDTITEGNLTLTMYMSNAPTVVRQTTGSGTANYR